MGRGSIQINLSMINVRINKETAIATHQIFLNKNPDFQREYDAWDDKLKTKFVETMLEGRSMNPIWTILNPEDNSEEILDGMHRITTATDFINNEFKLKARYLSNPAYKKYDKKTFEDLEPDDQNNIRNYNFIFNCLDSSYRTDINKRKDMYEILNRSTKTLNDYEFNKVLYNVFFELISSHKLDFSKLFDNFKDARGKHECEIIQLLILSDDLNDKKWSSLSNLQKWYLENTIGKTENDVNSFLEKNKEKIKKKLEFLSKITKRLHDENIISEDKKTCKKFYVPYKFMISRLAYKLKNISYFNRFIDDILNDFKINILNDDLQTKLDCKSRNAVFQRKLINFIDEIIDKHYDPNNPKNNRLFKKNMISEKLKLQGNKCNICKKDLTNLEYEGDHIIKWTSGGDTEFNNLQVLCKICHRNKN